ncbi:hypothetical protein GCM10025868_47210 [Angustibacter aerolatus]|uniref:ParB/Sulfiredoxin domain-containing protein n=1 Tax=Angustibacter aerolatus TaxID=1162965 RepID=A0ABQ6JRD5_9ACTN|nr:hypothetical protein GCM10025868_46370 [Angustibacter aerolatus]GMA89471.1 hypothetical protein GCM10025868_47210 [Angustibacter aerolatus]
MSRMSTPAAATATAEAARTIQHVDPTTLLVDVNVRHDARLTADFIASIRDRGVLQPIVAVRTADGALRVRLGHRRTLAAVTDARAQVLTLAQVLAAYEAATDVSSWRQVSDGTRRYLEFIAANGYTLAEVERRACGQDPLPEPERDVDAAAADAPEVVDEA